MLSKKLSPYRPLLFTLIAFAIGAVLRLMWMGDMEFKWDEKYLFDLTQAVGGPDTWPALGMPSSVGTRNPGMSSWIFIVLAKIFGAHTPIELGRAVVLLNLSGIALLIYFAWKIAPLKERTRWLWAAALVCVNPVAIQLQRKIWATPMPLFSIALLLTFYRREHRLAAFLWGFFGAIRGQIHMPGFYLAFGFVLWAWLFDRRRTRWWPWLAGSVLGVIPMLPWLLYLKGLHVPLMNAFDPGWGAIGKIHFWLFWVTEPLGLQLNWSLGEDAFREFLGYPYWGTSPTYLIGALHLAIAAMGMGVLASWVQEMWRNRAQLRDRLANPKNPAAFAQAAAVVAFGGLLTLSGTPVYRHYPVNGFPLEYFWITRGRRELLIALWCAELLLSIAFLVYIHTHHGAPRGDYWIGYQYSGFH